MSSRRSSQDSDVSALVPARLYPDSWAEEEQNEAPQPPPRAGRSGSRPRRGRGPLGTGQVGVNMTERQATTLAMALSSAFTLLGIERPDKIGPMPESCGRLLHVKVQQVLSSIQFHGSLSSTPSLPTCSALLKRIKLGGSVKRNTANVGPPKTGREAIEALFKLSDKISTRAAARQLEVSQRTIRRAAEELDMSWQKQVKAQFLSAANIEKRLTFSKRMLSKIENLEIDLLNVAWSDETWIQATDDIT